MKMILPMVRVCLAAQLALFCAVAGAPPAHACKCVPKTPQEYVQGAELVFVGRAGADKPAAGGFVMTFEVLHALKGNPGASFTWKHQEQNPLCGPSYTAGDVALLFASQGNLGLCAGNFGIAAHIDNFAGYLQAAGAKTGDVALAAMQAALTGALTKYLHGRASVPVAYAPLDGKSFKLGKSTFRFAKPAGKKAKTEVEIVEALSAGPLTYVAGRYPVEGYSFKALVLDSGKGTEAPVLLHVAAAEK